MSDLPPRLKVLDKKLMDLEVMMLTELEGLLAGVIVCPDLLPPSAWLPLVWTTDDGEPVVFDNSSQVQAVVGLIMDHYNSVIDDLDKGRYEPVFDIDTRNGDTLWELWAEGFMKAISLSPDSWDVYLRSADEEVSGALAMLMTLIEIADGQSPLDEARTDELTEQAPDLIPRCVQTLHFERLKTHPFGMPRKQEAKGARPGRNEACPCGSGKKYKKCCGLN